jgi:hypothetical protein
VTAVITVVTDRAVEKEEKSVIGMMTRRGGFVPVWALVAVTDYAPLKKSAIVSTRAVTGWALTAAVGRSIVQGQIQWWAPVVLAVDLASLEVPLVALEDVPC